MSRKDFRKHNDGFLCAKCGAKNAPALKSERNHCFSCLFSLHVDEDTPGDRKSMCGGLMEPFSLDHKGKKGFMIRHRCIECGKEILNRAAEDDVGINKIL
ncbi:RNHCP domain-containing protein [Candidatus Peregrinibacteria bacterium]|nr:RNHCP domain-containing protein [Candidatus Peregrinibacteria bacterium]